MRNIALLTWYSIRDELGYKSLYVLLGVGMAIVLLTGGCYRGNMVMNGMSLGKQEIVRSMAAGTFHFMAACSLFLAALLASRTFRNDRENGTQAFVLSKPVARWHYIAAKAIGLSALCFAFMLILHAGVLFATLVFPPSPQPLPLILPASALCGLNVVFVVSLLLLLSLFMPEFIAILAAAAVVICGYAAGPLYAALSNYASSGNATVQALKIACIAWPKIGSIQALGGSLIDGKSAAMIGPLHPAINLCLYTALCVGLLVWSFSRKEL